MAAAPTRTEVLCLYRALLRASRDIPLANRRAFVRAAVRNDFVKAKGESDPEKIRELVLFGETALDQIRAQSEHLGGTFNREKDMKKFAWGKLPERRPPIMRTRRAAAAPTPPPQPAASASSLAGPTDTTPGPMR